MSLHLDLPRLAAAIALVGILAMAVRVPTSPDMWWHLRCGEVQWRTRTVLKTETFSHTAPGAPWINQSWLPQLAFYGLHRWGGFTALALAVGVLVALTFGLVLLTSSAGASPAAWWFPYWRAFVLLWAAIAGGPTWAARPHLLTALLTALWAYLLERWRAKGCRAKDLIWLPPLMLLWANSHGGYVVGLLLLLVEIGGQAFDALWGHWEAARERKEVPPRPVPHQDDTSVILRSGSDKESHAPLVLTALLCALVVPINPQGLDLLLFPFRTLSSVQQGAIAEWASPDFHLPELWPFLALMLVAWAALALARRRPSGPDLLRALGFSAMALRSSRYVGLAAVILAPILVRCGAGLLARLERHFSPRSESATRTLAARARGWPAVNWGLLVVVLLGAGLKIAQPLNPRIIDRVHRERFPIAATDHLLTRSDELPPELFNEYGWGGYLIWRDAARVFIDGRADPYGDDLIRAYRHVTSVRPGWEETLARYGVRTALLRANSALGVVMRESAEWRETYADDVAVIFVRETEH